MQKIICGDSLEILPTLPMAQLVFADPPDNIGMKYAHYNDRQNTAVFVRWLQAAIRKGITYTKAHFWLSYYRKWQPCVLPFINTTNIGPLDWRQYIWHFTFGQHRQTDCGSGYRPQLRISQPGAELYPDAIRIKSRRQELGDKRADPRGRVPSDVWEFPRVCGNFKERRKWISNQHPEALIERIVKFTTKPGDSVIDMFGGSFTVNRVCQRLGRDCIGIDISPEYCRRAEEELNGIT